MPEPHHLKSLVRYRLGEHHCDACSSFPRGLLEDGLHLLGRGMSRRDRMGLARFYRWCRSKCGERGSLCHHDLKAWLKKITGLLKMGGSYIDPLWRNYTYWETFFGYLGYVAPGGLLDDVKEWLIDERHIGEWWGEEQYISDLYHEAVRYLKAEWRRPKVVPSLREWVAAGRWVRGKAGTGVVDTVLIDEKRVRTRRFKGLDAVKFSDSAIVSELLTVTAEEMIVMQKAEGAKVRPVVKTGNAMYRKMDFASEVVERGLYGGKTSTLFAGTRGNEEIDRMWMGLASDPSLLKVPLDQSSFDQHQSRASICAVLNAIGDVCFAQDEVDDDMLAVWENIMTGIFALRPTVRYEGWSGVWNNGIPSGWRWTALLDTILNICSFRVICGYCEKYWNKPVRIYHMCAQGDDVIFTTDEVSAVEMIVHMYQLLGYKVHPQKTYISRIRGEFLRRSYEPNTITGYIGRTQLALRFRNPIIPLPIDPAERLSSRLDLWALFVLRGGNGKGVTEMFLEDAEQSGVPWETAASYCLTPNCVGGMGVDGRDHPIGVHLLERLGGCLKRWVHPVVTKPLNRLCADIGHWRGRLTRLGIKLNPDASQDFLGLLMRTWGIQESRIVGEMKVEWEWETPFEAITPVDGYRVPDPSRLWDLDDVPVLVRSLVQKQAVEEGNWSWIRPEFRTLVLGLRKRMSKTVFRSYLLGRISVPSPQVGGVAKRYGFEIKEWAKEWVFQFLGSRSISVKRLQMRLLWLEEQVKSRLRAFKGANVWGV